MKVDARTLQTIAALHREADRLDREADRLGRVVAYPAIDHCNAKRARARALRGDAARRLDELLRQAIDQSTDAELELVRAIEARGHR